MEDGRKLICRYDAFGNNINAEETIENRYGLTGEMYEDILNGKYGKFSGHTHPGYSLEPGPEDEKFLKLLGQKRSAIWGNSNQGWEIFGQEPWLTNEVMEEVRREKMAKIYGGL